MQRDDFVYRKIVEGGDVLEIGCKFLLITYGNMDNPIGSARICVGMRGIGA